MTTFFGVCGKKNSRSILYIAMGLVLSFLASSPSFSAGSLPTHKVLYGAGCMQGCTGLVYSIHAGCFLAVGGFAWQRRVVAGEYALMNINVRDNASDTCR